LDVRFPLGGFVCITGVSGSGKSTLVNQTLIPALKRKLLRSKIKAGEHKTLNGVSKIDKVIEIDQSPSAARREAIRRPYTGVFDEIRKVFAKTREAKIRGYEAGRFTSTSRAAAARPARAGHQVHRDAFSCPTSTSTAKSATARATTPRPWRFHYRGKTSPKCWR
jgi:excinuclease ABC subunit A